MLLDRWDGVVRTDLLEPTPVRMATASSTAAGAGGRTHPAGHLTLLSHGARVLDGTTGAQWGSPGYVRSAGEL